MVGKGLFHTHLVVRELEKSLRFYTGLFGMEQIEFRDGTLVFLTTPGRNDLLALNPGGSGAIPEAARPSSRARKSSPGCRAGLRISATCSQAQRSMNASLHKSPTSADILSFAAITAECSRTPISLTRMAMSSRFSTEAKT